MVQGVTPQVPDSGIPIFKLHLKALVGPFLPPAKWQQNPLVYEPFLSFVLPGNLLRAQ